MAKESIEQVLIAEQMSVEAAKEFAAKETAAGRPTFFYDHKPSPEEIAGKEAGIPSDTKRVRFIYQPALSPEGIVEETKDGAYSGLMVRPKTVSPEVNVKFSVRVGTGVNNFDAWKTEEGHVLMNTPGQNASATAEYAVKALLRLTAPTRFDEATHGVLSDSLTSRDLSDHFSTEIKGKRIAVIGMGDIGIRTAQILKSFGADVVGWGYTRTDGSQSFSAENAEVMGIKWAKTLEEALSGADAATLHVPGGARTNGMIGFDQLSRMKPGAKIVNAARGPVIDAKGLGQAIESNIVSGFIADADWFQDQDKDPLAPYVAIIKKFAEKQGCIFLVTPHFGGDVTQETNYNGTMQGLRQISAAYWAQTVYNAQSAVPVGYTNGGVVKPSGIGPVTYAEVQAALVDNKVPLKAAVGELHELLNKDGVLTPEQLEQIMVAANALAHKLPTGRPLGIGV